MNLSKESEILITCFEATTIIYSSNVENEAHGKDVKKSLHNYKRAKSNLKKRLAELEETERKYLNIIQPHK